MTSLLLPQMMSRNGGIIVNLSSATSISVTAQATVYSATKVSRSKAEREIYIHAFGFYIHVHIPPCLCFPRSLLDLCRLLLPWFAQGVWRQRNYSPGTSCTRIIIFICYILGFESTYWLDQTQFLSRCIAA